VNIVCISDLIGFLNTIKNFSILICVINTIKYL